MTVADNPQDRVITERNGKTAVVRINREQVRNALDTETMVALEETFAKLASDVDVRVVILIGTGDRAFCAGMDLKAFAEEAAAGISELPMRLVQFFKRSFPKPLIAAVNGPALAGGCELMLKCDLVVAADHAYIGIPEVRRGLIAGAGGLVRVPERLPTAVALELALTGHPIGAQRAYELGLVNRVVPNDELLPAALELAEEIGANAPLALRASKEVIYGGRALSEEDAFELSHEVSLTILQSHDALEGARAFAEKREPNWEGR